MPSSRPARFDPVIAAIDRITEFSAIIAALFILCIPLLVGSELIFRNVFLSPLHFTWDVAGYLMGGCFLVAGAAALKSGSHVRVTALLEVLPLPVARVIEQLACVMGLLISAALSFALIEMAWLSAMRGTTAATAFRAPLVYPQSVLAFGAFVFTLQCLAQSLRVMRGEPLSKGSGLE